MSEKACRDCHALTTGSICPSCKTPSLSDDFSGLVIIFDPEDSAIAKVMEINKKGRYALRVRWYRSNVFTPRISCGGIETPFAIRTLVLPSKLRRELKSPLGKLIMGSPEETMKKLEKLVTREKPAMIISVGDVISENMAKHHILTHLSIVDNRVMRQPREPVVLKVSQTIHVKNPSGTITDEAWLAVNDALKQRQLVKIVVDGEEDLLTLVALLHAPLNALVVYGQPYEGIVAVKVTQRKRQKVRRIIEAMQPITKD